MPNAADIAQQIKDALALSIPGLDTSIGSVMGKFIDAASLPMSEAFLDQHLTTYQYDIDSMTSGTLEAFVRLFGIDRRPARFSVGIVSFGRSATTAAKDPAQIPVGTQVLSNTDPQIAVQTTASAVMAVNQTTVDVPVQALVAGSAGNVAAGSLVLLASDVGGLSSNTTNTAAMAFGADVEDDATLRARWKATAFRNLAGTQQMYMAMALQSSDEVSAVNVIGPKKTWSDRITISSGTSAAISFGNPAYIYGSNVFLGTDISSSLLLAAGTDYAVTINNTVNPATLTFSAVAGGVMADGDYDIQFDYVPVYSRNNPLGTRFNETFSVNNRIDVWVNGQDPVAVTQACKFSTASGQRFNNTTTSALYRQNFRTPQGTIPAANDIFLPLAYCPILSIANLGTPGFTEGVHYDIVHRSDAFGYAASSVAGLVWYASGSLPTSGTAFTISYIYNQVPAVIQQQIEGQWRLLGTDCRVHAGIVQRYRFNLAIIYTRGYDSTAVNTDINTALSTLLANLGFDSSLQVSDVLQAAHNVAGVDNVRFLNSTDDGTHYAIEKVNPDSSISSVVASSGRAIDIYFDDATFPQFDSTRIVTKTRTNFGVA